MTSMRDAFLAALKNKPGTESESLVKNAPPAVANKPIAARGEAKEATLQPASHPAESKQLFQVLPNGSRVPVSVVYGQAKGDLQYRKEQSKVRKPKDPQKFTPKHSKPPTARSTESLINGSPHRALTPQPALVALPRTSDFGLTLSQAAACSLQNGQDLSSDLLTDTESSGFLEQCHGAAIKDEREVALGFDFGTSSTKVVVGDAALGKSFAVQFCKAPGLNAFLLPSRIYQTGDTFSLDSGSVVHRDLKLSLLAQPEDRENQVRVVAFLAFAIRRSRGWLFTRQTAAYRDTKLFWKVAIGLPAANSFESVLGEHLKSLAVAAWELAASAKVLTVNSINAALDRSATALAGTGSADVSVVPELSAQIYGFVASSAFDKKASNKFLMVDVGAGTVDSSLFHVKPGKGNQWDFEFYTAVVEPHGVANLHRHRTNWWLESLQNANAPSKLLDDLRESQFATDALTELPASFADYFSGIDVKFSQNCLTPDAEFFDRKVLAQVRGKTLWRTWNDGLLEKGALSGIPFFLCGGGARSDYYKALEPSLMPGPSFRWLEAEPWAMVAPIDLEAEGLAEEDFDRISVAYGLSRLEVGKVIKALPAPKVQVQPVMTWRDNYVDKDQC